MSSIDKELQSIVTKAQEKNQSPESLTESPKKSTGKQWREMMAREAGIPLRYQQASPSDFPGLTIPGFWNFVFLTGGTGAGKTHLAAALAKQAMIVGDNRGAHGVIWQTAPGILLDIRATFRGKGNEAEVVQRYSRVPVLVIDDLGAEKITDWSLSSLYQILASRVDWLRKTIVTTNLSLAEIAEWEPRIASRLAGFDVCLDLGNEDRRLAK